MPFPLPPARIALFRAIAAFFALSAPLCAHAASIPGIPQATTSSSPAKAQDSDIQALLDQARRDAAVVESSINYSANAPSNATDEELKLRRYFVREAVRSYETLQRNAALQGALRKQLEQIKQQADTWTGLDTPPPYSVLLADSLSQEAANAQTHLKSLTTRQDLIAELRETLSEGARTSAATIRLTEERLSAAAEGNKPALAWKLEILRQRLRSQSAILRSLEVSDENTEISLSIARAEAKLTERKAETARDKIAFSEADYDSIKSKLDLESRAISEKLSAALDKTSAATDQLELARQVLAQAEVSMATNSNATTTAPGSAANKNAPSIDSLRQEVTLAEQNLISANAILDSLRYAPGIFEIKRTLWDFRYRLYRDKSPELIADAKQKLKTALGVLSLVARINDRQISIAVSEALTLEKALSNVDSGVDRPALRKQIKILAEREQELRLVSALFSSTRGLWNTLNIEMGGQSTAFDAKDKLVSTAIVGKQLFFSLWNYELFVAEDSIEVDGKRITGYSSITVGKVSRAIIIFAVGVLLSLWLARVAEAIVVRRFGFDAARAKILSKWFYTFGMLLLLVVVLTWVKIPLTVFAFLGGAVAIGLGFGMQNVLKNLISGLMLLFERPFQPGDLVEVGPLKGNVTEIGIRSSTIRDVNGVDTLIPNSLFVEQSVTNWTYDPRVRFCIKIGVAYGSPVRDVADMLAGCVDRHGLVLADPEPEVLFENFGADSLEFGVYFWLSLGPNVTGRRVCSDLRFIIEKTLGEHGIVIAYPQRDVHLDMAAPLRVEMVPTSEKPAPQGNKKPDIPGGPISS